MHQDANGGVYSGHFAIQGYNEVIILRRRLEFHKELVMSKFGGLYSDPHPDKDNDQQQDEWCGQTKMMWLLGSA